MYGKSKRVGRELFEAWSKLNNANFTSLIIPNVFGPFGNPYYNSVVATFCYQLTHNEEPKIDVDGELKLIYVNELVEKFYHAIRNELEINDKTRHSIRYVVPYTKKIKVSEILSLLHK